VAIPLAFAWKHKRLSFISAAVVVSVALYLPALLSTPKELIAGLFLFHLERPVDSSSLLHFIPEAVRGVVKVGALVAAGAVLARTVAAGEEQGQAAIAGLISVAMAFLFMAGSGIHRNWLFWIIPLMAVSVSLRLWSSDTDQTQTTARVSIARAGGSSGSP
jgi:hypothetical protein